MSRDRNYLVHRKDDEGNVIESKVFGPEDELPAWAAEEIEAGAKLATASEPSLGQWANPTFDSDITRAINERPFVGPDASDEELAAAVLEPVSSPEDEDEDEFVGTPPPKGGAGATDAAWTQYARANDVEVTDEMKRGEIIAACEAAGVPTE